MNARTEDQIEADEARDAELDRQRYLLAHPRAIILVRTADGWALWVPR